VYSTAAVEAWGAVATEVCVWGGARGDGVAARRAMAAAAAMALWFTWGE